MSDYEYYLRDLMNSPRDPDSSGGVPIEIAIMSTQKHNFQRASLGGYTYMGSLESSMSQNDYNLYQRQIDAFGKPVKIDNSKY